MSNSYGNKSSWKRVKGNDREETKKKRIQFKKKKERIKNDDYNDKYDK